MRGLLVLSILAFAVPAGAQDEAAERPTPEHVDPDPSPAAGATASPSTELDLRREAGRLALGRGELERALDDFRVAYELAPEGDRLLDVADVLDAMRRDGELRAAYRAFLEANPEHPRATEIRTRLAVLDAAAAAPAPRVGEPPEASAREPAEEEEEAEGEFYDQPWFWAVAAILIAGGLVGVMYAIEGVGVQEPIPGDDGYVIGTLVEW